MGVHSRKLSRLDLTCEQGDGLVASNGEWRRISDFVLMVFPLHGMHGSLTTNLMKDCGASLMSFGGKQFAKG
jgi:hypothetical protein